MSNIAENICESIQIIGESLLEGLSYDKTVVCTIIDDSDRDKGKYVVQENGGVTYEAYTENTQYRKKNQVYVTIPGNDYNNQKMIIGKKITDENEPIVYSTPFDTIIDIVDLEIDEDKKGVQSLVANRVEQSSITLLEHNSYSQPYYGFTRLGLSAEFRSWLRDFNCFTGEYGLKVTLDFVDGKPIATERLDEDGNSITEMTYPVIRKELYLNHKDMIGNLYSFDTFYNQQKVFDISSYNGIGYIKVEFYEKPGSFLSRNKNEEGNYIPVPYVDDFLMPLDPNLFISNFDISIGYDLSDYNNDFLQLYSFDTPTYSSEEDIKNINLKWIHLDGENQIVMNPDRSEYEYEIRWYRYLMGEPAADAYVTGGWTSITNELNEEFLTCESGADSEKCYRVQLKPDVAKKTQEEIKAIVLFGEKGRPYEEYSFEGESVQDKLDEYYKNSGRFYWYYSGKDDDYFYENCENKVYDSGVTYYQPIITNDLLTYKAVNATDVDEKNWEDKKDNLFLQVSEYVNCNQIPRIATKIFTSCQNDKDSEFNNAKNYYYSLYFKPKKDLTAIDYYKNPERYYVVTSTSETEKVRCSENHPYIDLPNYYYTEDEDEKGNYELANPTLQEYENDPGKYYIKKQIFSCQINQIFNKTNSYWIISKAEAMTINEEDFPTNKDSLYKYTEDFNPKNRQFYVKKSDTRQVFRTEPIIFSNDVEIDNKEFIQDELQALSALSLRCFDEKDDNPHSYTYGNYFLYNELKELINYEESKVIRGVHCDFNLIETNDNDTHELFNADSISWIIPYGETMINVYNKENKLPEAINLNINLEETLTSSEIKYKKYTYTNLNDVPKTNNAPAFYYTIGSRLMAQRGNNLIRCEVVLNGRKYTASYDLTFGEGGTSGTKYTFQIEITSQDQVLTVGKENKIKLTPILYDAMGKEIDISNCPMDWKFVDPQNSDATIEAHNDDILTFSLNGEGLMGKEIFVKSTEQGIGMNTLCIVKGTLEWESYKLTDYVVIPIRSDVNYTNFTGPTEIIYLTDGTPYYDRTYSKFAMGYVDEEGSFQQRTTYYWNPYNGYVSPTTQSPENFNSQQETQTTPLEINIYYPNITKYNEPNEDSRLQPVSMYIEQLPIFAIQVKKAILENNDYKEGDWVWTQPILIIQNSYPSSVVNEWDGKKLVIDESKQLIFGKMLGAGRKETDNSFTGVLMGDYGGKANDNTNLGNHAGIFGFNKGVQCFSFTDDGKATIGSASGAQLKFDGSSSGGSIASNSYEQNKGIKIDFDDAIIDLRNTFTIEEDGKSVQIPCFVNMDASSKNNDSINDYSLQIGYGNSPNFKVNWAGDAYMNNANIQGELNSSCYISGNWSNITGSTSSTVDRTTLSQILSGLNSNIQTVKGQVDSINKAISDSFSALTLSNELKNWRDDYFKYGKGAVGEDKYLVQKDLTKNTFSQNVTSYYYWVEEKDGQDIYMACTDESDWDNRLNKTDDEEKNDYFYLRKPGETETISVGYNVSASNSSDDWTSYMKSSSEGISIVGPEKQEFTTSGKNFIIQKAGALKLETNVSLVLSTASYGSVNPTTMTTGTEGQVYFYFPSSN